MNLKDELEKDELPKKIHRRLILLVQTLFKEWSSEENGRRGRRSTSFFVTIIWVVFFLGAFAGGAYFSIKSILHFLEFGTTTSISIVQFDGGFPMPAVSICSFTLFATPNGTEFVREYFQKKYGAPTQNVTSLYDLMVKLGKNDFVLRRDLDNLRLMVSDEAFLVGKF
jgi:hypothetical protein